MGKSTKSKPKTSGTLPKTPKKLEHTKLGTVTFNRYSVTVERGNSGEYVKDESDFFYKLKNILNRKGLDLIKKKPEKDGHMFSAPYYLRARDWSFAIVDNFYALRDAAKQYKEGLTVRLEVTVWE